MTAKIYDFSGLTYADLPPDLILEAAVGQLKETLVIGYDNDGKLYIASSSSSNPKILWLLEMAKKRLLYGELE